MSEDRDDCGRDREGAAAKIREGDDEPVHNEVDHNAVQHARENRPARQEFELATRSIEDGGCREGNHEMESSAQCRGLPPALKRLRAKEATGNPLENSNGLYTLNAPGDEGRRDVQDSTQDAGPQDGREPPRFFCQWGDGA